MKKKTTRLVRLTLHLTVHLNPYFYLGLRGAIAFALALHLPFDEETKKVLVSTTLVVVLFTIIVFGGSTSPVIKV